MPSPRFQHGFENDIFISYTHVDDKPDAVQRCWISQFEVDLKNRLEQVSGQAIQIWRDSKLGAADRFDGEIQDQLERSAVLLVVLSPSYFHSDYCTKERNAFRSVAPDIGYKARIVKVAKEFVDLAQYPADLKSLNEYRFYDDDEGRQYPALHLLGATPLRYALQVDRVAREVAEILRLLDGKRERIDGAARTVFLAESSGDIDEPRNLIRDTLLQNRCEVLPRTTLRTLTAPEIRKVVVEDLQRCNLSIHPVGARYGFVPELATDESIVRIQLELAAGDGRNGALPRLVWIPEGTAPAEERQKQLLTRIRNEWAGQPFEVIEAPWQKFETDLNDRLRRAITRDHRSEAVNKVRPSLYLICSTPDDRKASRSLRFWLHEKNFDLGSAMSDEPTHRLRLTNDDAFMVYYGACDEAWVRERVTELIGLKRTIPPLSRCVFLANPETENKQEFMIHDADVVHGYSGQSLDEALSKFAEDFRSRWEQARQ